MPAYIGIDTGKDGAIALLASGRVESQHTPTSRVLRPGRTPKGNKRYRKISDLPAMWRILTDYVEYCAQTGQEVVLALENVHTRPTDGKVSAGTFLENKGIWLGMATALNLNLLLVSPGAWRPVMVGTGAPKAHSNIKAKALFPELDFSLVKDHNRAEALLIAEYARRKAEKEEMEYARNRRKENPKSIKRVVRKKKEIQPKVTKSAKKVVRRKPKADVG